ncbi:hypothetical protein ACU4GG_02575 [Streptomyces nojiriensis]
MTIRQIMSWSVPSISRTSARNDSSNSACERRSYQSRCMAASSTSVSARPAANPARSSPAVSLSVTIRS